MYIFLAPRRILTAYINQGELWEPSVKMFSSPRTIQYLRRCVLNGEPQRRFFCYQSKQMKIKFFLEWESNP